VNYMTAELICRLNSTIASAAYNTSTFDLSVIAKEFITDVEMAAVERIIYGRSTGRNANNRDQEVS